MARDELAGRYAAAAAAAVSRAIRASRYRSAVAVFVSSPIGEYRHTDRGGRTAHERAFTRACYAVVWGEPGEPSGWSLKLTWRDQLAPSAPGRKARAVALRVFPSEDARVPAGRSWVRDQGFGRSAPGRRIDG